MSVLLVERDPQVAQLLLLMLAAPGEPRIRFDARCVEDLESGLRSLKRGERFDAVVLGLPRDADEVLERLGALRRSAPVVALEDYQVQGRLDSSALKRALGGVAA